MNDLLKVLQSGDLAGLEMEKARAAVDAARLALDEARTKFEFAKQAFEDVMEAAEESGLPRAKFKKLIEERTAGLWTSGLVTPDAGSLSTSAKSARAPRKKKSDEATANEIIVEFDQPTETEMAAVN